METEGKTIQDFKEILRRRKWGLVLPALIIFIIAAIVALSLTPIYRSSATILIEEQEIPKEYAMSMVTSYADQRIQSYNQRIMSSSRLIEIIHRFNLYADLRKKWTVEEVIDKMRKDIKFQTINPEVVDRRTGRSTSATIAFTVSYEGENPGIVQQVANVLASLYLEENLKVREEKTAGASKFIEDEMNEVQASLANQDARIAEYKQKHLNSLPELSQLNLQEVDRVERAIEQLEIQMRAGKERESILRTQLAGVPPDVANPDKDRLKELRVKMVFLMTRYSDEYPDVIKTKAEIAELEKKLMLSGGEAISNKPDNPAYINISTQLAMTESEIDSLQKQIAASRRKRDEYRQRVQNTPRVEEGYRALMGERNNLQIKYDDLMKKYMETKVASGLEKGQMGERFTLIDPPRIPEKPVRPNIPAILLIGLFLGIGGGIGNVSLKEYSDQSVRSVEALSRATGIAVLASIPEILTPQDIAAMRRKRWILIGSIVLLIIVCVGVFHFFIMDLDVFWAKLMRRFAF
jgi:polysaccharide chain length determinant protein (PEP-CTERM system associated)